MNKLAYHYNKKKQPTKTDGKFLYYYPCSDADSANVQIDGYSFVAVEVTEKEWEALIELDRIEYNNDRKFTRHNTTTIEKIDNPKTTQRTHTSSEKVSKTGTTKKEKRILSLLDKGYTQKQIAMDLGVKGYVSKIKKQAQIEFELNEYCTAIKTQDDEYLWKCWNLFVDKMEMPMFLDVQLEYVLGYIHPDDIWFFMYWFYSFGEFIRYVLKFYLYNEDKIEEEKAEYLSKASKPDVFWFNQNYADTLPLIQIVYIRLNNEIARRIEAGMEGRNKASEGIYTAINKLAQKANISPDEFIEEKLYPIMENNRSKRYIQFQKFYKH